MAELRAVVTVPVTAQFAGLGAPSLCAPMLFETSAGDIYILLSPDQVLKVGGAAGSSDFILAGQSFSGRQEPQAVLGDACAIIAARVFSQRSVNELPTSASEVLQARSLRSAQLPAMWR